jgi:hypothetical protein
MGPDSSAVVTETQRGLRGCARSDRAPRCRGIAWRRAGDAGPCARTGARRRVGRPEGRVAIPKRCRGTSARRGRGTNRRASDFNAPRVTKRSRPTTLSHATRRVTCRVYGCCDKAGTAIVAPRRGRECAGQFKCNRANPAKVGDAKPPVYRPDKGPGQRGCRDGLQSPPAVRQTVRSGYALPD